MSAAAWIDMSAISARNAHTVDTASSFKENDSSPSPAREARYVANVCKSVSFLSKI